ncbi:MAG: ABC transporter ATP-binding protein [Myxococcales bacterium]|nr:ABC transporter ATP-binding protein [Myxococcales bacterium]
MSPPLLEVRELCTRFSSDEGDFLAVDGVSFSVHEGATLGLVGESGCGKTVAALSVMRLLADPPGRVVAGSALFRGRDLLRLTEREMRQVRGREISMVFQEPMSSLNPVLCAGEQVAEALRLHQRLRRAAAARTAEQMLGRVGIPDPGQRARSYPHELSGGMRQRVMIAMALACGPSLLIADEPTTALDVTVQAQILELLRREQAERRMAMVLITHDLGVVAETCDEVAVMYAGRVVERAPVQALFAHPAHPYTAGLLSSLPSAAKRGARLVAIPGTVPAPWELRRGCRFRDRCDRAAEECARTAPLLEEKRQGQWAACHRPVTIFERAAEGAGR